MDLLLHRGVRHSIPATTTIGRGARRATAIRLLGIALAAVLLATLFVPLAPAVSAAGDSKATDEADAALQADAEQTPATENTPIADETPVADETTDAALTGQDDPHTSAIYVVMRECDNAPGDDFQQYDYNCSDAPRFSFDVYGVGNNGEGFQQTGAGSNYYGGLPAGQYTIRAFTPQGYQAPSVFCARDDVLNQAPGTYAEVVTVDGYHEFELAANQAIRCHWFFTAQPAELPPDARLWLHKLICPGDDAFDWLSASQPELYARCVLYDGADVSFNLYSHTTSQNLGIFVDPSVGAWVWREAHSGAVTLTEHFWVGGGKPVVYCYYAPYDGEPEWFRATVSGSNADFSLRAGTETVCHWFTVPVDTTPGALTLGFSLCPPVEDIPFPFDYADADINDLANVCSLYRDGAVSFNLYNHADGANLTMYTDPATGVVRWITLAPGVQTISTEPWSSYGAPRMFCYTSDDPTGAIFEVRVQGWKAELEVKAGTAASCDWFNIPAPGNGPTTDSEDGSDTDGGEGTVTVVNHACPEGTGELGRVEAYAETCTEAAAGVAFKLDGESTGNPGAHPTDAEGQVTWSGLEDDHYYLSAEPPAGYGEPVVFCGNGEDFDPYTPSYNPDGDPFTYRIEFDLEDGEDFVCSWFNVPRSNDAGSLTIYPHVCSEDGAFDPDAPDVESLLAGCEAYDGDEIDFALFSHLTAETQTRASGSGPSGSAYWETVAAGLTDVSEGSDSPVVACEVPASAEEIPVEVLGERARFQIPGGQDVVCRWFFAPPRDERNEDGGEVVVTTWVCPQGDEVYDLSHDALYERCSEVEPGVSFLLYGAATELQGVTNEDGRLTFGPLAAGEYRLSEDLPDGYGEPIVSCWLNVGDGALGYETAPEFVEVGGQDEVAIGIELRSGTSRFCDWFSVPASDPGDGNAQNPAGQRCLGKHTAALSGTSCGVGDTSGTADGGIPSGGAPRASVAESPASVGIAGSPEPLALWPSTGPAPAPPGLATRWTA